MIRKILFVCMGNICRSPSAEAVFKQQLKLQGLTDQYLVESAGTHSYHIGNPPDKRSIQAALKRGMDMRNYQARKVSFEDFERFDFLIAMDDSNYRDLQKMTSEHHHNKILKMMGFSNSNSYQQVPDPYYGQSDGFELVLDLLEDASEGLLRRIG